MLAKVISGHNLTLPYPQIQVLLKIFVWERGGEVGEKLQSLMTMHGKSIVNKTQIASSEIWYFHQVIDHRIVRYLGRQVAITSHAS